MRSRLGLICFVICSFFIVACDKEDNTCIEKEEDSLLFSLLDDKGNNYNSFILNDSTIHISLQPIIDLERMGINPSSKVDSVKYKGSRFSFYEIIGKKLDLSDFSQPVEVLLGDNKWRKLNLYNLPVLIIDTPNAEPIESKETRIENCCVRLVDGEITELGTAGIRGRGSSSWQQPKKPYNIKFDKKQAILGMNSSKHWLLLANAYYDRTQLHNSTAFEIARLLDYPWVQDGKYVELILNGTHVGLYYLCEKIRAEKDKINLNKSGDGTSIDECGYLLESYVVLEKNKQSHQFPGNYFDTGVLNTTGYSPYICSLGWEIKEPEDDLSYEHISYIQDQLIKLEESLVNHPETGEYRELFDVETAINWWITEEITLNDEASRTKNMYIYKNGTGKFTVGPPWDFDAWTFGSDRKKGFSVTGNSPYFICLFNDPYFVNRLKEKWSTYKSILSQKVPEFIDERYQEIEKSALRNELMWPNWHPSYKYPDVSYKECVENMKRYYLDQLEWLDNQIELF